MNNSARSPRREWDYCVVRIFFNLGSGALWTTMLSVQHCNCSFLQPKRYPLRAVGGEDLVNFLLSVSLRDALFLCNDLGERISVARGGFEVISGELWVLASESSSNFF